MLSTIYNRAYSTVIKYLDGAVVSLKLFLGFRINEDEIIKRNTARTFGNPWKGKVKFNDETVKNSDYYAVQHVDLIIDGLKVKKQARIIDAGCRNGRFLELLYSHGYKNVEGIELVPEWVEYAHSVGRGYVRKAEITKYVPEKKYDVVYSRHTLEHLPYPFDALKRFDAWCEKGGYIVIVFPLTRVRTNKHLAYLPSIKKFRKMIKGFSWEEIAFDVTENLDTQKIFGKKIMLNPEEKNEVTYIGKKM